MAYTAEEEILEGILGHLYLVSLDLKASEYIEPSCKVSHMFVSTLTNILIMGANTDDHLQTLETVLTKLEEAGIRLKRSKCFFMLPSLEYPRHKISSKGLQPTGEKVKAIHKAPAPKDVFN